MYSKWVFKITTGGFNSYNDSKVVETQAEVEAYSLNEAWKLIAASLPLNTMHISLVGIH